MRNGSWPSGSKPSADTHFVRSRRRRPKPELEFTRWNRRSSEEDRIYPVELYCIMCYSSISYHSSLVKSFFQATSRSWSAGRTLQPPRESLVAVLSLEVEHSKDMALIPCWVYLLGGWLALVLGPRGVRDGWNSLTALRHGVNPSTTNNKSLPDVDGNSSSGSTGVWVKASAMLSTMGAARGMPVCKGAPLRLRVPGDGGCAKQALHACMTIILYDMISYNMM